MMKVTFGIFGVLIFVVVMYVIYKTKNEVYSKEYYRDDRVYITPERSDRLFTFIHTNSPTEQENSRSYDHVIPGRGVTWGSIYDISLEQEGGGLNEKQSPLSNHVNHPLGVKSNTVCKTNDVNCEYVAYGSTKDEENCSDYRFLNTLRGGKKVCFGEGICNDIHTGYPVIDTVL